MTTYLQTAIEDALAGRRPALAGSAGADARAFAIGDGPPLLRLTLDQCWERLGRLRTTASAADNPAKRGAERIAAETGVRVDANPYAGITKDELEAVIRAAHTAEQPPEVLLALWAKEGSTRSVTAPLEVPGATSAANARSMFRSSVFFAHLGIDHFVVFTAVPGQDNRVVIDDASAPRHEAHFVRQVRALVAGGLLAEDISGAINGEIRITTGGGRRFAQPTTRFYALVLLLVDALFTKHLGAARADIPGASPALAYLRWNMRLSSWRAFVRSADRHRREKRFARPDGQPITSEQWALHTPPAENEFGQARRNAIRVMFYIGAYAPIFALANLQPGIDDLRRLPPGVRLAGLLERTAAPIDPYRYDATGTACATGPQPGATALMAELGRRFGGRGETFSCRAVRGGRRLSLHGEGRAVDWYRDARDPAQAAEAQRIVDWLLGADAQGNAHALARRMGVQEIIWDRLIWTAPRHAEGWRPYGGADPHTSHVHIGLSWAGARMRSSHWAPAPGALAVPAVTETPVRGATGSVADAESAPVLAAPDETAAVLGRLRRGKVVRLLAEAGPFYAVGVDGTRGYVRRSELATAIDTLSEREQADRARRMADAARRIDAAGHRPGAPLRGRGQAPIEGGIGFPKAFMDLQRKLSMTADWGPEEEDAQQLLRDYALWYMRGWHGPALPANLRFLFGFIGRSAINAARAAAGRYRSVATFGGGLDASGRPLPNWCTAAATAGVLQGLAQLGLAPTDPMRLLDPPPATQVGDRPVKVFGSAAYAAPLLPGDMVMYLFDGCQYGGHTVTVVEDLGDAFTHISGNAGDAIGVGIGEARRLRTPPRGPVPFDLARATRAGTSAERASSTAYIEQFTFGPAMALVYSIVRFGAIFAELDRLPALDAPARGRLLGRLGLSEKSTRARVAR